MSRTEEKPSTGSTAADGGNDASKRSTSQKSSGGGNGKGMVKIPYFVTATVVVVIGLVASNLVPQGDILFAVLASLYIYIYSRVVFPTVKSTVGVSFPKGQLFFYYINFAAIIGLILPLVLILISWFDRGDQSSARDAAPHLFLLCAQVLSERFTNLYPFSLPVKALVPIIYNARRLITVWTWTVAVFSGEDKIGPWVVFERSIAVVNILFWNFNLWAFLLPRYLPWVFRTYYAADQRQG